MNMSWFPFNFNFALPSLTPPLSIQRRFISFLLRRFLGHLLKPGQLDISQVDAQIGSGFVEVKDLELDCNVINSLLGCQPLQLESGTIATVTARIPWPNPFSSTVGLSLSRLRLNLRVDEGTDLPQPVDHSDDLANSVASVAETFIHDELTEKEGAQLRQSIHEGQGAFDDIPGSMSSFLGEDEDAPQKRINDPEGVSIFAGLFESLLARFDLDASDSQISMIYDDVVLTLGIGQIHYFTTAGPNPGQTLESRNPSIGQKCSIRISGVKMAMQEKNVAAPCPSSPAEVRTRKFKDSSTVPCEGSDTELDDETQTMMSQSLASLPAHLTGGQDIRASLSLSTNSSPATAPSMYESAISTIGPSPRLIDPSTAVDALLPSRFTEKTILSLSEPITFQLTTPPVVASEANTNSESSLASNNQEKEEFPDRMKLDVSSGILAISLDARCVHCLLRLVDALTSAYCRRPNKASSRSDEALPTMLDRIDISLHLKGSIALIFGSTLDETEVTYLSHFHERPLVPPRFAGGYVRLHVDLVKMALKTGASSEPHSLSASFRQSSASSPSFPRSSISHKYFVSCTAADFSVLLYHAFRSTRGNNEEPNYFSPVLITDHHLDDSYRYSSMRRGARADNHIHPYSDEEKNLSLPDVDVVEWYSEHVRTQGASLRPWRSRAVAARYRRSASSGLGAGFVSNVGLATSPTMRAMRMPPGADVPLLSARELSAISVRMRLGRECEISSVTVETAPLHLFVNLELLRPVTDFLDVALPDAGNSVRTGPSSPSSGQYRDAEDEDRLRSPNAISEQRRRLEKFVLEDLNLDLDYPHSGEVTPRRRASPPRINPKRQRGRSRPEARLDVLIPLVRVEVRAPPPRNHQPRTGSLLLDVHSVHFSKSALDSKEAPRIPGFATTSEANTGFEEWFDNQSQSVPVSLKVRRVFVAYAALGQPTAKAVLSFGPIGDMESRRAEDHTSRRRLFPQILFRTSELSGDATSQHKPTALLARIPSVHATVGKVHLDGLQLWIDDVTQCIERLTSGRVSETSTDVQVSRASSLIGSRYFIQRSGSGSTDSEMAGTANPTSAKSELVIKLCFSEVFIRLLVPMLESAVPDANRFIDICASDLDTLIEVKPEGKDETVVSSNVLVVSIKETSTEASRDIVVSRLLSIDRKRPSVFTLRFRSVSLPGSVAKESKVRMVLDGLAINLSSDVMWVKDLASFVRTPPGAFESVIPSERTFLSVNIRECALRIAAPSRLSAFVLSLGDVSVSTDLVNEPREMALGATILDLSILLNDDSNSADIPDLGRETDAKHWMSLGYALIATIRGLTLRLKHNTKMLPTNAQITLSGMLLNVHLCADTISGIIGFVSDLQSLFPVSTETNSIERPSLPRAPIRTSVLRSSTLLRSLDEQAFRRQPVIGPLPDMVNDDLPKNPEYLDASFGAAAGLRALDDDEDDFYPEDPVVNDPSENIISRHGGETIKMLYSPIEIIENFFDTLTPSSFDFASEHGKMSLRIRMQDCEVHVLLYDGYDWERTRHAIREEVKRVKRRLAKIRQLLASGQTYDPNVDATGSVLFNSVHVGLEQDPEDLEGEALLAAIDDELAGDTSDVMSEGSWQSFQPEGRADARPSKSKTAIRANKLDRVTKPSIEFALRGMAVDFDQYLPGSNLASRLLSTVRDLEILDHIKTSTWSTFLTELRTDSQGNIRETGSNMVRIELQTLQPFEDDHEQEARLKAKILPLRLHVDQDALDFLKVFFSFKDSHEPLSSASDKEIFFQHVEIFPVDIKLDYKPRRVDYKALKEGRTIELMNFFHFDGSEMTLRHLTLKGVTGWPRLFDLLNDLWTPDVKANQLADVISGVSPIRSAVNVGSGIADLVLLPIAQYKKDGRIIRGLQKGATAFMKSTAMEAIKLGARLATGTQVVLEQTEHVLGAQFSGPVTAEALQSPDVADLPGRQTEEATLSEELYSRYAEQPVNVKEGVQSAYRSLSRNIKYAGQTILAVPMEVYERSSTEGPARAVIRAVPIAVLKPMIGASEAVSKTLMGLHNTLDPQAQIETEAKYKHR